MKIKKILIVPAQALVEKEPRSPYAAFFLRSARQVKRRIFGLPSAYNSEIQRYGDIPKILGAENTYFFGRLYTHLHLSEPPQSCPYPSCHATPRGTLINEPEIDEVVAKVDAVLVSIQAGERRDLVIKKAKKRDMPVAILDAQDHQAIYQASDIRAELSCGLKAGEQFDIYFKENLPLGYGTDIILPLAPAPLRPEVYRFRTFLKSVDVFHSGKARVSAQPDNRAAISLVQQKFSNSEIIEHKTHGSFLTLHEYWDGLSRARFALSPSRFDWDSFRHCETALAPATALIAPKPYVETTGPPLRDGVNAVLYNTECRAGRYYLRNPDELVEKIRFYLERPQERERLAARWAEDVLSGHTILARSRYILEQMERAF